MKLKELKEIINNFSEEELNNDIIIIIDKEYIHGVKSVEKIENFSYIDTKYDCIIPHTNYIVIKNNKEKGVI